MTGMAIRDVGSLLLFHCYSVLTIAQQTSQKPETPRSFWNSEMGNTDFMTNFQSRSPLLAND